MERESGRVRERAALPDAAAAEALAAAHEGTAAGTLLLLAWRGALTRREIAALRWEQVAPDGTALRLPDREVPLEADAAERLLAWRARSRGSGPVLPSGRGRGALTEPSLSRLARQALDGAGLTGTRLSDLRRAGIVRMLRTRGWAETARITGVEIRTLRAGFARYLADPAPARAERTAARGDTEALLEAAVARAGGTQAGLALLLARDAGLSGGEIVSLTWDRVEPERIRLPDGEAKLTERLKRALSDAGPERERTGYVLCAGPERRPLDLPRLSRLTRAALIRGGLENLTLQDVRRFRERAEGEAALAAYLREHRSLTRRDAEALLGLGKGAALSLLNALTASGALTRVGKRYYRGGAAVPEEHLRDAVRAYLETNGSAYRKDLAEALGLEPRQAARLLRAMAEDGALVCAGQRYRLPRDGG